MESLQNARTPENATRIRATYGSAVGTIKKLPAHGGGDHGKLLPGPPQNLTGNGIARIRSGINQRRPTRNPLAWIGIAIGPVQKLVH